MFSQRNEEKYIVEYFKDLKKGRFLDIGAYDGKTFSNTRQLALNGWGGVLVEPSPSLYKVLEQRYGGDKRYRIVKLGIGRERGVLPFYNFGGDAVSSFDLKHAKLWTEKGKRKYKKMLIKVITMNDLLDEVGEDFDFINLDIEGWSVKVFMSFPFERLQQVKMICVEFDRQVDLVEAFASGKGFRTLHKTAENLILVRK